MTRTLTAIAVAAAACGGSPSHWPESTEPYAIPLVEAWRPDRWVVRAHVNGRGPVLALIDTGLEDDGILAWAADDLGLPVAGDAARGRNRVRADRLDLGPLTIRDWRPTRIDLHHMGEVGGQPIVIVLGVGFVDGTRLRADLETGFLHLDRSGAEVPPPAGAVGPLPLARDAHRWWTLRAHSGGRAFDRVIFATGARGLALSTSALADLGLVDSNRNVDEDTLPQPVTVDLSIGGQPLGRHRAAPWRDGPDGIDGVVGLGALASRTVELDGYRDRLWFGPSRDGPAAMDRWPRAAECGPRLAACVRGRVVAVERGRARVDFESGGPALPTGFWARIDLGPAGAPFVVLIRFGRDRGAPRRAVIERDDIGPSRLRAVGTPIDVVDLVPTGGPCTGDVCVAW